MPGSYSTTFGALKQVIGDVVNTNSPQTMDASTTDAVGIIVFVY